MQQRNAQWHLRYCLTCSDMGFGWCRDDFNHAKILCMSTSKEITFPILINMTPQTNWNFKLNDTCAHYSMSKCPAFILTHKAYANNYESDINQNSALTVPAVTRRLPYHYILHLSCTYIYNANSDLIQSMYGKYVSINNN